MKKILLIAALGGLLFTSCSKESVGPEPEPPTTAEKAIAFNRFLPNIPRADVNLETVSYDFGVWAIKTAANTDLTSTLTIGANTNAGTTNDAKVVMANYLVGFNNPTALVGYFLSGASATSWFYDGLGNTYAYTNAPGVSYKTTSPSVNNNQYLKYWDLSYAKTYFVAYAPYNMTTKPTVAATDDNELTMNFGTITTSNEQVMYGATEAVNAEFTTTTTAKKVDIKFIRAKSEVEIKFYEEIPGYSVTMDNVWFNGEAAACGGSVAIPYEKDASDVYSLGSYLNQLQNYVVTYTPTTGTTTTGLTDAATVSYTTVSGADKTQNFLVFANPTGVIAETQASATPSPTVKKVIYGAADNSGLQFVFDFTLKALDGNETIKVRGARVDVPNTYTNWDANTHYTYIFKFTQNVGGTTGSAKPTPDPVKPDSGSLYPIIFDKMTVTDMNTGETTEFPVN